MESQIGGSTVRFGSSDGARPCKIIAGFCAATKAAETNSSRLSGRQCRPGPLGYRLSFVFRDGGQNMDCYRFARGKSTASISVPLSIRLERRRRFEPIGQASQ